MPIIAGAPQQPLSKVVEQATSKQESLTPPRDRAQHIGLVFVHGIGSQKPGDTILDWSRPLIKLLTEWRQRHGHPPDPVLSSRIDFAGAELPMIELDIPAQDPEDKHPHQVWHVTEAWWASNVRPPTLSTMAGWLATDMGRVIDRIQASANGRRQALEDRRWWIDAIDALQSAGVAFVVGVLWFAGLALGLPYAVARSLPLVGDKVAIAQLDSFLVDWFGDLRVLLHDPAQAASIRGRLAEALTSLRDDYACSSIVVVAHSGGAIVSLTTLSDPAYVRDGSGAFPVTKLITLGQGMDLGWELDDAWNNKLPFGDRLLGSPYAQYPGLRWLDFWGTYDPAPAGAFKAPSQSRRRPRATPAGPGPMKDAAPRSFARDQVEGIGDPRLEPKHSQWVWNRMSVREDHGTYWDNEEQFVVPLLREIDTGSSDPEGSRFFQNAEHRRTAGSRRIERVAILGWWRWAVAAATGVTLLWAWHDGSSGGSNRLADIGAKAAEEFAKLPGHEAGSGLIDASTNIAHQIGAVPYLGSWMAAIGQLTLGFVVVLLVSSVPGWFGVWRRVAGRSDRKGQSLKDSIGFPSPAWLPLRSVIPAAVYGTIAAVVTVGSRLSLGWALDIRSWLADRATAFWSAETGNLVVGAIVVAVVFAAIYAVGNAAWGAWDERERWVARTPGAESGRTLVKLAAVGLMAVLVLAFLVIALVGV